MIFHLKVKIIFITLVLFTFFLYLGCTKKNAYTEIEDENNTKPPIEAKIYITPTSAKIGDSIKIHIIPKQIKITEESLKVSFKPSLERENTPIEDIKIIPDEEHTILHFKLPDALTMNAYTITVTDNENGDIATYEGYAIFDDASIKDVVILENITPSIIDLGIDPKKITINGRNFSTKPSKNTILFLKDDLTVETKSNNVLSTGDIILTFNIPDTIIHNVKDKEGETHYFIQVTVDGKTNSSATVLPLTIKNSKYPTFSNVKYSTDETDHGTNFTTTHDNLKTPDSIKIYNESNNTVSYKLKKSPSDDSRMYFPDNIPAGKYYLKVCQNNEWLTAINKDKESIIEVKPYITEIFIDDDDAILPYNDKRRTIIEGANLTDNTKKAAFTLKASDFYTNFTGQENNEHDDATKLTYDNFSKDLPAGKIIITSKDAQLKEETGYTLTFYKPVLTNAKYDSVKNILTITGGGFSSTKSNNILTYYKDGEEEKLTLTPSNETPDDSTLQYQPPNYLSEGTYVCTVTVNSINSTDSQSFIVAKQDAPVVTEIETFYIDNAEVKIRFKGENLPSDKNHITFSKHKAFMSNEQIGFKDWNNLSDTLAKLILKTPASISAPTNTTIKLTNTKGATELPFVCFKYVRLAINSNIYPVLHYAYLKNPDCIFQFFGDNLDNKSITYSITDEDGNVLFYKENCEFIARNYNNKGAYLGSNSYVNVRLKKDKEGTTFSSKLKEGKKYTFVCEIPSTESTKSYKVTLPFYIIPSTKR
ncbi:MAG: hypothetical protein ACRC0A_03100 [Chitinophagaceae bacterium]